MTTTRARARGVGAWALNGERRHLTPSQRAVIAVKMLGPLKEEAKKRQEATSTNAPRNEAGQLKPVPPEVEEPAIGEAVKQAAKLVGVGATLVYEAKVVSEAPGHFAGPIRNRTARPKRRERGHFVIARSVLTPPATPRAALLGRTRAHLTPHGLRCELMPAENRLFQLLDFFR